MKLRLHQHVNFLGMVYTVSSAFIGAFGYKKAHDIIFWTGIGLNFSSIGVVYPQHRWELAKMKREFEKKWSERFK